MKNLVVHCKRAPFDVYIGRPGPWGNPFSHLPKSAAKFRCSSREEAIERYAAWLLDQPDLVARVKRELRDRVLGCWCAPLACHGDILSFVANDDTNYADWAEKIRSMERAASH